MLFVMGIMGKNERRYNELLGACQTLRNMPGSVRDKTTGAIPCSKKKRPILEDRLVSCRYEEESTLQDGDLCHMLHTISDHKDEGRHGKTYYRHTPQSIPR